MISFSDQNGIWNRMKRSILYWLREPKTSFTQRLVRISVLWGIPMACLELIGIPFRYWAVVLIFVLPATALGVVAYALLEQGWISYRNRGDR